MMKSVNCSIAELPGEDEIGSSSKEEELAQKGRNYDAAEKLRVLTRLRKWRWTSNKTASPPAKIQAKARKQANGGSDWMGYGEEASRILGNGVLSSHRWVPHPNRCVAGAPTRTEPWEEDELN
ncbi:uncharacterized protein DS421_15g510960 [Arachis hypogaea]|nr:uncharacterized protein DS421_15g510960 [Arachis hypogaea]